MTDRRVYARSRNLTVVRYDRAGKWYIEAASGLSRIRVSTKDAVRAAHYAVARNDGEVFLGLPGGGAFDRLYRGGWPL